MKICRLKWGNDQSASIFPSNALSQVFLQINTAYWIKAKQIIAITASAEAATAAALEIVAVDTAMTHLIGVVRKRLGRVTTTASTNGCTRICSRAHTRTYPAVEYPTASTFAHAHLRWRHSPSVLNDFVCPRLETSTSWCSNSNQFHRIMMPEDWCLNVDMHAM